jgi:hypothetical protein
MDAWYVILQLMEYVKDVEDMLLPDSLKKKFKNMADVGDREMRLQWCRIQQMICTIIHQDVCTRSGAFFYGHALPPNNEIELCLEMSREDRSFNSLQGCVHSPRGLQPDPTM